MKELLPPTKALLKAAKRADAPPPRARDRLACRLANAVAASTFTAGAAAAETSLSAISHSVGILSLLPAGKMGAFLAVSIGFAGGGAVMATAYSYSRPPAVSRVVPQSSALVRDLGPQRDRVAVLAPSAQPVVVATDKPNENQHSAASVARTTTRAQQNVAEETRLLGRVQQALRTGNGALAWKLLGLYRRDYGRGALDEEASAAEVFALCAMGRTEQAKGAATRFLRQFPESPLDPRVRQSCGAQGDGTHFDGAGFDGSHFDGRKTPAPVTHD